MKTVTITRVTYADKSTAGVLSVTKDDGYAWTCKTLELPDKANQQKISCIPKGTYEVVYSMSPSFKKFTYEIKNVPGRAGIRIHPANFTRQLLGCIALGKQHIDIDKDGTIDVSGSVATVEEFENLMNKESFTLKIQ